MESLEDVFVRMLMAELYPTSEADFVPDRIRGLASRLAADFEALRPYEDKIHEWDESAAHWNY